MPSSAPAKARKEHKRVNAELSRRYCDWRRIAALYDVRSSPAYADLDSCKKHAERTALRLLAACWHPTKADDPNKGTLRFPDSRNVIDKAFGKVVSRCLMGTDVAFDMDFITKLIKNGDREYLRIVLDDLHKRAREKVEDWDTAENAFVRFLVAMNATPDKLCARQAGRPKNAERDQVILWVYEMLDSIYGPELDKECAHLERKTLIGILSAALECGYYGSSRKGKSELTEDRLTKIIFK